MAWELPHLSGMLQKLANEIRKNTLVAIHAAGSGHPGGSLSAVDVLTYLWAKELNNGPRSASDLEKDRFILSKGHACPALYAVAAEFGLIPRRLLLTFRKLGSPLQGHPHIGATPWADASTGSLGQGFSAAIGTALGLRYKGSRARVYVMLGDGELQEGEVWEGAMCAGHHDLDNLCAIVDYNKMQSDDLNENIMRLEPLRAKWEAFGWHVAEIDGHNFQQIASAFGQARRTRRKPTVIIAHTIKGKGVSFMEASPAWHGSVKLRNEELEQALHDLQTPQDQIGRYLNGTIWKAGSHSEN